MSILPLTFNSSPARVEEIARKRETNKRYDFYFSLSFSLVYTAVVFIMGFILIFHVAPEG
jgi:hypothetical protein